VKSATIRVGAQLSDVVLDSLKRRNLRLRKGDIVAVASKLVSICEGRVLCLSAVRPSRRAEQIGERWHIDKRLVEMVLHEADAMFGGVPGFLLTLKDGILTANAGIDLKNCPPDTAVLWPSNSDRSATKLRLFLQRSFGGRLGVMIVDSRVTPLRLGTVGLAIGVSGFSCVRDYRGVRDLYGRKIRITRVNIADDLAASTHLLMGEAGERIGIVAVRNAPIALRNLNDSDRARLDISKCLITNGLLESESRNLSGTVMH
jgi:coenzyme F420-0:L-glutamate ligase/coenzyme F420-1:gamma-L-glutamate ligase